MVIIAGSVDFLIVDSCLPGRNRLNASKLVVFFPRSAESVLRGRADMVPTRPASPIFAQSKLAGRWDIAGSSFIASFIAHSSTTRRLCLRREMVALGMFSLRVDEFSIALRQFRHCCCFGEDQADNSADDGASLRDRWYGASIESVPRLLPPASLLLLLHPACWEPQCCRSRDSLVTCKLGRINISSLFGPLAQRDGLLLLETVYGTTAVLLLRGHGHRTVTTSMPSARSTLSANNHSFYNGEHCSLVS